MASNELLEALGADVEPSHQEESSYINIQLLQRVLNSIKPVTNHAASELVSQADAALDKAYAISGDAAMENQIFAKKVMKDVSDVRGHLHWHAGKIGDNPEAIYEFGDDLKKYVVLAFSALNETIQGVETVKNNYLFSDKVKAAKVFYAKAIQFLATLAQKVADTAKTTSKWVGYTFGAVVLGAVGYGWYNLKMAKLRNGSSRGQLEE